MKTILETVIGSRAYGLEREDSDWDRRSIYVLPTEDLLKIQEPSLIRENGESMELIKFCRLAAAGSPNQIEYLYSKHAKAKCVRGDMLLKNRHWFLSKKMVPRYIGFLKGNLKRYEDNPKAQVQAFRLVTTCLNLLRTGELNIQMAPEHMEIVAKIRGGLSIIGFVEVWVKEIREAEAASSLRSEPDYDAINKMILFIRRLQ